MVIPLVVYPETARWFIYSLPGHPGMARPRGSAQKVLQAGIAESEVIVHGKSRKIASRGAVRGLSIP